jgi:hypothetical protein
MAESFVKFFQETPGWKKIEEDRIKWKEERTD